MPGKFDGLGRFADPSLLILTSPCDGPKHGAGQEVLAEQLSAMQRMVRVGRQRTSTAWGT